MALTNCPECGHQISDKAQACPSCGHPLNEQSPRQSAWPHVLGGVAGQWISTKALVVIIVGTVMFVSFAAIMIALILSN